jgi:signal transduction histidine kinase
MRPRLRLIIMLLLLVLIPVGLIAWLGVAIARQEQEREQQRLRQALAARLSDIRDTVGRLVEREARDLQRLTELQASEAEPLRELVRGQRLIRQLFVLAPDGAFLFPPPGASSEREREALQRLAPVWKSAEVLHPAGAENGASPAQAGWHTWFADGGVQLFYWRRLTDGRLVGVELESNALLADVIALLPASDAAPADLPAGRIVLQDARNSPLYQWGGYRPDAQELPLARLACAPPLNAWSLEYYVPAAQAGRAMSGSARFNVGAAIGVVALTLAALALALYRASTSELRAAAQKVSFVNQVSHELKTPLTNICLYADLLAERIPEDDEQARGHIGIVIAESRRLGRLIGNILTFARQQKARLTLHPAAGTVDAIIADTLENFRPVLQEAGVRIAFTPGAGRPVLVDADALAQILGNLFSNVEKYAVGGQALEVTSRQTGDRTEIRVADRGPGIPAAHADDIFQPFVRLSNTLTDGVSGTGIGLAIARDLARLHGGDLTLEPAEAGACFRVDVRTPAAPGTEAV